MGMVSPEIWRRKIQAPTGLIGGENPASHVMVGYHIRRYQGEQF